MATKSNLLKKVPKRKRRMSPITVEEQYTGPEPEFTEGEEIMETQIGAGFNYYTYHKNVKDAKKYIAEYLADYGRIDEAKQVKACPDVFIIPTYGWIARMSTRGAKFNVEMDVIERLDKHIEYICKQSSIRKEKTTVKQEQRAQGPTIQDRIKDQSDEMDSQFVQWTDMYVENTNLFNPAIIDPYGYLQSCNCTQAHARRIKKDWETELVEFKEALKGTDDDLKEAYSHLLKNKRMEGLIGRYMDLIGWLVVLLIVVLLIFLKL